MIKMKYLKLIIFALLITGISSCSDDDVSCEDTPNSPCCQSPEVGPCNAAFPRFYFDNETGSCQEFVWGGCNGVVPFETLEECEACQCNTKEQCEE